MTSALTLAETEGLASDILLVEDNPGDVRLIQEAFLLTNPSPRLHVTTDGVEAMAYLRQEAPYARAARPTLILLDLNLPRMDGREALLQIKADENLATIPVVILTTSDSEADILRSYQLKANCYLIKPVLLDDFDALVKSINDFWLTRVALPRTKNRVK